MIKCPHCNKSKNREYNYIRIQTFIVCMISPLFWLICRHSLPKPFTKRTVYPSITPTFFIFASSNIIILIPMAANNQKNTRILLFLLLCIRITLTVDANDFLFTSINTAQGLSDNQIRYILQLPDGRMVFTTNGMSICMTAYISATFTARQKTFPRWNSMKDVTASINAEIHSYGLKIIINWCASISIKKNTYLTLTPISGEKRYTNR